MKPYADTNFITSLFCQGPNTEEATRLHRLAGSLDAVAYPVSLICRLEVINALQHAVFSTRNGVPGMQVNREYALVAEVMFLEQMAAGSEFQSAAVDERVLERRFHALVHRHTAKEGFRTYDILHVSTALALGCDTFWSFDIKAKKLARLEGLAVN